MNRQFIRQEGTGIRALACTEGCHDHPEERKYPDQCQDGQTRMYDKIRQFLSNAVLIIGIPPHSSMPLTCGTPPEKIQLIIQILQWRSPPRSCNP